MCGEVLELASFVDLLAYNPSIDTHIRHLRKVGTFYNIENCLRYDIRREVTGLGKVYRTSIGWK